MSPRTLWQPNERRSSLAAEAASAARRRCVSRATAGVWRSSDAGSNRFRTRPRSPAPGASTRNSAMSPTPTPSIDVRDRVLADWPGVDVLVIAAAGTNIPNRSLHILSVHDFRGLVDTNLVGIFHLVHAFLPAMRRARTGHRRRGRLRCRSHRECQSRRRLRRREIRRRGSDRNPSTPSFGTRAFVRARSVLATSTRRCSRSVPFPRRPKRAP